MKKLLVSFALIFLSLSTNALISDDGFNNFKVINWDKDNLSKYINNRRLTGFISGSLMRDDSDDLKGPIVTYFNKNGEYGYIFNDSIHKGTWKVRGRNEFCMKDINAYFSTCHYFYTANNNAETNLFFGSSGEWIIRYNPRELTTYQSFQEIINAKETSSFFKAEEKKRKARPMTAEEILIAKIQAVEDWKKKKPEEIKKRAEEGKKRVEEIAEKKKKAEERAAAKKEKERQRKADAKKIELERIAERELNKKIALIPPKTELQIAQNFLNDIQLFVKQNKTEFNILEVAEFMINAKPILDGSLKDKDKKNLSAFMKFANNSYAFKKFREKQLELETQREIQKIDKEMRTLVSNIKFITNGVWTEEQEKKYYIENTKTLSALIKAVKNSSWIVDEMTRENNQIKIANKHISDLTLYLSENMTSDLATEVMSNLKKLKNALKEENILEIRNKDASLSLYLAEINSKANLFIRNNIPQTKVESKVPKVETYPVSSVSYYGLNRQVGCKSDYSAEKERDIFNSNFKNHWMTWKGRIIIASSNSVSLDTEEPRIDFFKTDLTVSFEESGAGYNLKQGQTITVRFLMKTKGGCYSPFEGVNATIVN